MNDQLNGETETSFPMVGDQQGSAQAETWSIGIQRREGYRDRI